MLEQEMRFTGKYVCLLDAIVQRRLAANLFVSPTRLTDVVHGLIVFLQAVYVIGLRLMADRLAEPYGSDLEDLSVMYYVNFTWTMSRRILEAELPEEPDLEFEEELINEAEQSVGYPWQGEIDIGVREETVYKKGASAREFELGSSFLHLNNTSKSAQLYLDDQTE